MALSILDGNQSATTLSTILSSGQHITAHTVVSLGSQAITDIRGAVSGGVVSISSLPAITGTVTAGFSRVTWTNYSGSVVTANTAVTAISTTTRSYLLAQVTTGQMFVNIGATATSVNSVYFSAGQGFAWETTVPQGIVSIISAVTGTNYVLKEG